MVNFAKGPLPGEHREGTVAFAQGDHRGIEYGEVEPAAVAGEAAANFQHNTVASEIGAVDGVAGEPERAAAGVEFEGVGKHAAESLHIALERRIGAILLGEGCRGENRGGEHRRKASHYHVVTPVAPTRLTSCCSDCTVS